MSVMDKLNAARIIELFVAYLEQGNQQITRAQAEERMWAKLENPGFLSDIRPLLSADVAEELTDDGVMIAFARVMIELVSLIPGKPWARSPEMAEKFSVSFTRHR